MMVDRFLAVTAERMPTAAEVLALCGSLGWTIGPGALHGVGDADRELGRAVAALINREPLRTQVIAAVSRAAAGEQPAPPPATPEPAGEVIQCGPCNRWWAAAADARDVAVLCPRGGRPGGCPAAASRG